MLLTSIKVSTPLISELREVLFLHEGVSKELPIEQLVHVILEQKLQKATDKMREDILREFELTKEDSNLLVMT